MKKPPLVLIVEDSPTQAQQFSAALIQVGAETLIAHDGREGLQVSSEHHPDAIVLDINLPFMDGFQVCRRLKRDPATANIPVVMLTVSEDFDTMIQGMKIGADDYIPKDEYAVQNLLTTLRAFGLFE